MNFKVNAKYWFHLKVLVVQVNEISPHPSCGRHFTVASSSRCYSSRRIFQSAIVDYNTGVNSGFIYSNLIAAQCEGILADIPTVTVQSGVSYRWLRAFHWSTRQSPADNLRGKTSITERIFRAHASTEWPRVYIAPPTRSTTVRLGPWDPSRVRKHYSINWVLFPKPYPPCEAFCPRPCLWAGRGSFNPRSDYLIGVLVTDTADITATQTTEPTGKCVLRGLSHPAFV